MIMNITNARLSYQIIDKMRYPTVIVKDQDTGETQELPNVTSKEIDLLIYLSTKQNAFGQVQGVYYRDFCLQNGCCPQTYYNAKGGLENKGYIVVNYRGKEDGTLDLLINDNIFVSQQDYKDGYFSTNKAFLHSPEFRSLKANEKKIAILIAIKKTKADNKGQEFKLYPKTIAKWIGVKTVSHVYRYMKSLDFLFPATRVDGNEGDMFVIDKKIKRKYNYQSQTRYSARELYWFHRLKNFFKRYNITYTLKDLKDLVVVVYQYDAYNRGLLHTTMMDLLLQYRSAVPKVINKVFARRYNRCKFGLPIMDN